MKKILAVITAAFMLLGCLSLPKSAVTAEAGALDAANLNEALNVPGGTLEFSTGPEYPWAVEGEYAKSGNSGVADSRSSVRTTVNANEGDVISFDFWSRGEGNENGLGLVWDGLQFRIDGDLIEEWGRREGWERYAGYLPAGTHELSFEFKKDGSVDADGDCAYLDNVYVGAPVLPASVSVQPVVVKTGRRVQVEYAMLPETAFDTSASFSIDNTAVATVDETGVVTGVSEGSATITVTSFANPSVSASASVTVLAAPPAVELRGISVYDMSGAYTGHWVAFNDYDPSQVTELMPMLEPFGQTYAAAFAGGMVYGYMHASMGTDTRMYVMDPVTNQIVFPGGSCADGVFSMAYDHSSDRMFALCGRTGSDEPRYLGIVELATGNVTRVAPFTGINDNLMSIAIDGEGNCYGLTAHQSSAMLVRVDLETAVCTPVGPIGVGLQYFQDMVWDHNTNQLFWAQYTASYDNGLYTIDPATGSAAPLGVIGSAGHELCCLYTVDDLPTGPIAGNELAVRFIDGVNGSLIEERLVPPGTVLDEASFPAVPEHPDREFQNWNYGGEPIYNDTEITARFLDPNATVWDFESDPLLQGFEFEDADGDELSWRWSMDEPYINLYEGAGCAASFSFGEGAGQFGTDNWMITPEFCGTSIKFWMNGQDPDGYMEPLGIYVSTDGGETWSDELAYFIAPRDPSERIVYLNDYAGQNIRVGFRHYTDLRLFRLNVDYISAEGVSDAGLLGDADLSGGITAADALLILRHSMELSLLEGRALALSDVNGDGYVSIADAVQVLRMAAGLA